MFETKLKIMRRGLLFLIFSLFLDSLSTGAQPPSGLEGIWDPAKYISIDEIKPDMDAYCLTVYKGTKVEKFDLDVVSVVRKMDPGRDAILVSSTDERFIQTGPVAGCSGSPVYIDGRLAGALAFAWPFAKEPLYGVTPIQEMLRVGQSNGPQQPKAEGALALDFSKPLDFDEIYQQITTPRFPLNRGLGGATALPCPLIASGLPPQVVEQLNASLEGLGLVAIRGVAGVAEAGVSGKTNLVPGACLALPLVSGDIEMTVFGTVTEVVGNKVYGFGHSYLGYGQVEMPLATGYIHTVVTSLSRSFKLASVIDIVGALTADEAAAVHGEVGEKACTIPLRLTLDDYRSAEKRQFKCEIAKNRMMTPMILRSAVAGAVLWIGDLPPDHTVEYKGVIKLETDESIPFENISTGTGLTEMVAENVSSVGMLMNNPYKQVGIESIDLDVRVVPENIIAHIWSADVSDSRVKAGQTIAIDVVIESYLSEKKKHRYHLTIPEDLPPGKYELAISGAYAYEQFLRKASPLKFVAQSLPTLIEALNELLSIERDKLYCLLALPSGGLTIEKAELPDLPPTKAMVLQSAKRTLRVQPYRQWLEKRFPLDVVVNDKKSMFIIVEP
jgi:hypothetical protein